MPPKKNLADLKVREAELAAQFIGKRERAKKALQELEIARTIAADKE